MNASGYYVESTISLVLHAQRPVLQLHAMFTQECGCSTYLRALLAELKSRTTLAVVDQFYGNSKLNERGVTAACEEYGLLANCYQWRKVTFLVGCSLMV